MPKRKAQVEEDVDSEEDFDSEDFDDEEDEEGMMAAGGGFGDEDDDVRFLFCVSLDALPRPHPFLFHHPTRA